MIMDRQMQTVDIVYFSPTHSSEKIAKAIASGIGVPRRRVIDLTLDRSGSDIKIADGDFVILCAPVYAGRVAPVAVERFRRLKIEGKDKAVVAVAYGNRDYDDALVELYDIAVDIGLEPVAAGLLSGSIVTAVRICLWLPEGLTPWMLMRPNGWERFVWKNGCRVLFPAICI